MKSLKEETQSGSSMLGWLDSVQMSEHDREIAKAYLRKTEAVIDLIWLTGARIRAALARERTGPSGHAPRIAHRA
jgi:hypothetical protein